MCRSLEKSNDSFHRSVWYNIAMKELTVYCLSASAVKGKEEYLFSVLPAERVQKARRYFYERDRLLSLAAGYLIYRLAGEAYADEAGKLRSDKLFFSVSHSEDLAALAVSEDREVGLDIEKPRSDDGKDRLAAFCFSEEEFLHYRENGGFLALFTAKESLVKAEGHGLVFDVKTVPALPADGKVEYREKEYFRHSFDVNGYVGSVTQEGEDFRVKTEEIEVQ